ncbi:hypothetical protein [Mesorhizobium sp. 43Arga]
METTFATTDHASILTVRDRDRNAIAAVTASLSASTSPLASQATGVVTALKAFGENVAFSAAKYQPAARNDANRKAAADIMAKPFQAFTSAGIAEGRAAAAANATALGVDPGNAPLRAQTRDRFDAMDTAGQAAFAQRASVEELAALMEAGRSYFANTPDPVWQMIEDQYSIKRHIARTGLQADFQRQPDPNDPVAFGADENAAMDASRKSLAALRARSGTVDAVRSTAQSIIDVVAVATDLTRDEAWKLLTTGKTAA